MERAGDHDAALASLALAEQSDPSDGYLPARRAELLIARGDLPGAVTALNAAIERHPDASVLWMVLAEARHASGDARGAQEAAARALAIDSADPDVRALSARMAGADRDTAARARETAPNARAGDRVLDPASPLRHRARAQRRLRAAECFRAGQWRAVDQILTPMVDANDAENADRVRLIEARAYDGRPMDAARLIAGVRVEGEGAVSRIERARLWLLAGRAEQARAEAEEALTADGEDPRTELVLGEALATLGRWDLALARFERITPLEAGFAESRVWAARGMAQRGLRSDAVRLLDASITRLQAARGTEADMQRMRGLRSALAGVTGNDTESMSQP